MHVVFRALKKANAEPRQQLVVRYHAADVMNTQILATTRTLLTGFLVMIQVIIVLSLVLSIRMNINAGFVVPIVLFVGGVGYTILKLVLEYQGNLTRLSKEFRQPAGLRGFNKEDKCRLASCRPWRIVIGNTFTITRQTFATISQDIILGNVVNILVAY